MENVEFVEPGEVHAGTGWEKFKTGLRHLGASFPFQHLVKTFAKPVQIENIAGGIILLCLRQLCRAPVR